MFMNLLGMGMIVFGVAALSLLFFGDDSDQTRRKAAYLIMGQGLCFATFAVSLATMFISKWF